jgi:hypothetical protein
MNTQHSLSRQIRATRSRVLAAAASACISLSPVSLQAEDPYVLWAKAGPNCWAATCTALSPDGHLHAYPALVNLSGLLRFDSDGRIIEINKLDGINLQGLAFDPAGNRFMAGSKWADGVFTSAQTNGFFVAKFNERNELLWARDAGLPDNSITSGTALALDSQGNTLAAGTIRSSSSYEQYAAGDHDGFFLQKYTPDGQRAWVRRIEHQNVSIYYDATIYDLAVDPAGNAVIAGYLSPGVTDFGATTLYPPEGEDGRSRRFLARFTPDGTLQWAQLGFGMSAAVDQSGNIYTIGAAGLVKLAPSGQVLWTLDVPANIEGPGGIAVDTQGSPVFTGEFEGTVQFGPFTLRARSSTYQDFFIAKASPQGQIQWAMAGGGAEYDRGNQVVCDTRGNVYLTGVFRKSTAYFDGLTFSPRGSDLPTLFAAKLSPAPVLRIGSTAGSPTLSWPAKATNYVLEAATSLPVVSWTTFTNTPTVTATNRSVQLPATGSARFFRLRQP